MYLFYPPYPPLFFHLTKPNYRTDEDILLKSKSAVNNIHLYEFVTFMLQRAISWEIRKQLTCSK